MACKLFTHILDIITAKNSNLIGKNWQILRRHFSNAIVKFVLKQNSICALAQLNNF